VGNQVRGREPSKGEASAAQVQLSLSQWVCHIEYARACIPVTHYTKMTTISA